MWRSTDCDKCHGAGEYVDFVKAPDGTSHRMIVFCDCQE